MKRVILAVFLVMFVSNATAGVVWGNCRCHPHLEIGSLEQHYHGYFWSDAK